MKLIKGCVFGGCIVYIWMMLSWMVLPWHCVGIQSFKNESVVTSCVRENTEKDGLYMLPNFCDANSNDMSQLANNPIVFMTVQHKGFAAVSYTHYLTSLITQLVGAFLITFLLLLSKISQYWNRVLFVTLIGLIVGILGELPNWNWWGFSLGYVTIQILDLVIGWFLAGLVISLVAKIK